jgi:septum formation protein
MQRLILASSSPRRRELLAQAGFSFDVHPAHIPEDPRPEEDPIAYVVRLAREKAQAVFNKIGDPLVIVVGADTTVTLDGHILGKPEAEPTPRACCGCSPAALIASLPG